MVKVARGSVHGQLVGLSMCVRWLVRESESVSLPTHEDCECFAGKLKVYLVMCISTSDTWSPLPLAQNW